MPMQKFPDPKTLRQQLAPDPHRPLFHFLPPHNWMNDPNGLFFWKGRYHLFYQYNPREAVWGTICWGHASSLDMVHWVDHPPALVPEKGTGDENGCWSGCIVEHKGVPTAVYSGFVEPERTPIMLAHAEDDHLDAWKKSSMNPVIAGAPGGVRQTDFRDPYVWRESDRWKMLVGAGMTNGDSAVFSYDSPDLVNWTYRGPFFRDGGISSVRMWECPNLFPLGERYVLLVSLFPDLQGVYYFIGDYDGRVFSPTEEGYFERGSLFYAPQTRLFPDGRVILFGWILEDRSEQAVQRAGWAGVQSLPRQLAINAQGCLVSRPIDELKNLRGEHHLFSGIRLGSGGNFRLPLAGQCLEVEAVLAAEGGRMGMDILVSPDGSEYTRIFVDFEEHRGVLDTTHSSLSKQVNRRMLITPIRDDSSNEVRLHVWIDRSVIEVWFNDDAVITGRVYPTRVDARGLGVFSSDASGEVKRMHIWEMGQIWPADHGKA